MKKILIIIAVLLVFSFVWFFQDNQYKTLEDLERLFMEHDISYIPKPVETNHILDIAKEQRIYEIENNHIYVYIVNESDIENADYRVSNEILGDNYIVSNTKIYIFAHTEKNLKKFQKNLNTVIEEIRNSEQ